MKLTQFRKLKKAVDSLDVHLIRNKIGSLERHLQNEGLALEPENTAITQEGIFYIEPESGIATKVIAYIPDFPTNLTKAQRANLADEGYQDESSVSKFHPYHLMRCNTLSLSERENWKEQYQMTKRTSGKFFYRIVSDSDPKAGSREIYQEIQQQPLYICSYCLWKVSSILVGAQGAKRETFELKSFFDVNMVHSWNSQGVLSKDYGFTKDMYPEDWIEICRIRQEQVNYTCECCFEELAAQQRRRFLYVNPTDHVEGQEGYVKLECLCIRCLADIPAYEFMKERIELKQFLHMRMQDAEAAASRSAR